MKHILLLLTLAFVFPIQCFSITQPQVITLEASNTVVLRGVITEESVDPIKLELIQKSTALNAVHASPIPLFLFLETPGGSIDAGLGLIEVAKALPNEVKTITHFAASMGFITAQFLGERLITPSGILMSHRAKMGTDGQYPGELDSRLNLYKSMVDDIEVQTAARMQMSFKDYMNMIYNEYWTFGKNAVRDNAADKVVIVQCGESLMGERRQLLQTMFGPVNVTWSQCPLISTPLHIDMSGLATKDPFIRNEIQNLIRFQRFNLGTFVKDYIETGIYRKYLK